MLKITDFDCCYTEGDTSLSCKGTRNFRAPELMNGTVSMPDLTDVYSAAIVLFVFKFGILPYSEDPKSDTHDLMRLLQENPPKFWERHQEWSKYKIDEDFKELFEMMTRANCKERATIQDIKESRWFKKSIYTKIELT
mmetsp:Transcript_12898/g.11021  ORF Transcript_12898/g.11021 Transcript_12898/m.11021 type:complete len:138 (-) Transcript_12898:195-608(-)